MMKKYCAGITVLFIVVMLAGAAHAVPKSNVGCGLGYLAFKGQDGLMSQTAAATTNGTFGNQTFGITSGTSECDQFKTFASNEKVNHFVAENMDNLAKDIAKGNGEYLNTLAVLLEVPETQRGEFYSKLQTHFTEIYSTDQVTSTDVLNNIEAVVSKS
jgi:hypothetical protein